MPLRSLIACVVVFAAASAHADCSFTYGNAMRHVQCYKGADPPCTIAPSVTKLQVESRDQFNALFKSPYFGNSDSPDRRALYYFDPNSLKLEVRKDLTEQCAARVTFPAALAGGTGITALLTAYAPAIAYGATVLLLVGLALLIVWKNQAALFKQKKTGDDSAVISALENCVASMQTKFDETFRSVGDTIDKRLQPRFNTVNESIARFGETLGQKIEDIDHLLRNEALWKQRFTPPSPPPPPSPRQPAADPNPRPVAIPPVPSASSVDLPSQRVVPPMPVRLQQPPPLEPITIAWRLTEDEDQNGGMKSSADYIDNLLQCLDVKEHTVDRGGVIRINESRVAVSAVVALDQGDFFGFLPRGSEEYVVFPRAVTASGSEDYTLLFKKLFNVPAGWMPGNGQRIQVKSPARIPKRVFDPLLERGDRSVVNLDTFDVRKGELALP
jgi:hypothetical protein